MPGEPVSTFAKFVLWKAGAKITDGDFATGGATYLGTLLPSSDLSGEADLATGESADGPVAVGADIPGYVFRIEGIDPTDMTALQAAKEARTQGYFYAVAPGLNGYTAYGQGRVAHAYYPGHGTERDLPHGIVGFTARGDEPQDLVDNYTAAVTLPA